MNATRTTALLVTAALAACTAEPAYPTEIRRVPHAGKVAELYGAPIGAVCEAIAAAACESSVCSAGFMSRCSPPGITGRVEATTREGWDELWTDCFAGLEYDGATAPASCTPLLLVWAD